jgi:hypothetical protein
MPARHQRMKTISRNIILSFLILSSVFASVGYQSCSKDKCSSVVCANGGSCDAGICICAAGYYGKSCDSVYRSKFVGTWSVSEKGSFSSSSNYSITITYGTRPTDVLIGNFYNFFETKIKGYVTGDTLFIPSQQWQGKVIIGTGYLTQNSSYGPDDFMVMQYEVIDSATQSVNNFGCNNATNPSLWSKN